MDISSTTSDFSETDLFENAFNHAAIGMALVGLKGEWLKVNKSLCDLVGYSEEELRQLTFQDITYPEDLKADLDQLALLADGAIPSYRMEKRYITKSGSIVWVLLTVSMVPGPGGKALFYISQIKDITHRKLVERERDALFQLPLFLHAVVGFDGYVKRVNPVWIQTFGHPWEFWQSTPYLEFVHPDEIELAKEQLRNLANKIDVVRFNLRVRCADGGYLHTVWCAHGEPEIGVFYASGFDATPLVESQEILSRTLVEHETLLAELQRSQSEILNLRSKLVTICAWTKRVRCNDQWMSVDEFLVKELGLNLTHGMSAEAEEEFMKGGLT